jgi:hypothetical protein
VVFQRIPVAKPPFVCPAPEVDHEHGAVELVIHPALDGRPVLPHREEQIATPRALIYAVLQATGDSGEFCLHPGHDLPESLLCLVVAEPHLH